MLIQLGHENIETGEFVMCEQRDIQSDKDMAKFMREVKKSDPLPNGCRWLAVKEGSNRFLMQAVENG